MDRSGVITSRSAAETRAVGRSLGRAATPGTLLALTGPLGAGKTQLAKGVAEGLAEFGVFPTPDENPDYYVDYGETGPYVAETGESECAT